jgi:hypothetical protein
MLEEAGLTSAALLKRIHAHYRKTDQISSAKSA